MVADLQGGKCAAPQWNEREQRNNKTTAAAGSVRPWRTDACYGLQFSGWDGPVTVELSFNERPTI